MHSNCVANGCWMAWMWIANIMFGCHIVHPPSTTTTSFPLPPPYLPHNYSLFLFKSSKFDACITTTIKSSDVGRAVRFQFFVNKIVYIKSGWTMSIGLRSLAQSVLLVKSMLKSKHLFYFSMKWFQIKSPILGLPNLLALKSPIPITFYQNHFSANKSWIMTQQTRSPIF